MGKYVDDSNDWKEMSAADGLQHVLTEHASAKDQQGRKLKKRAEDLGEYYQRRRSARGERQMGYSRRYAQNFPADMGQKIDKDKSETYDPEWA